MIRALIDTNVILDALASREPFRNNAEKIFMLVAEEKIQGFITASSSTDIYYLLRKTVSNAKTRAALRSLFQLFMIVDISGDDCEAALESSITDYEDALVAIGATKAGVEYIVTRDKDFLKTQASIRIVSPATLLQDFFL